MNEFTCEVHDLAGDLDALPDGEVGDEPADDEGAEQRPHHRAHVVDAVSDLKHLVAVDCNFLLASSFQCFQF